MTVDDLAEFRRDLVGWYESARRDLPWRRTRDPYAIWLSEVMLQQTRVAAVIPYYTRFLARFPDVAALASAPEADLLAQWAGLGYYYRARNLQQAARMIVAAGGFPNTYSEILELPGIGDYTAAAVASIAFDLPHAVVDGNVLRVLSRVWNDRTDIASAAGRKRFTSLAAAMLDEAQPANYNQALMELGAMVCLPKAPHCLMCPVAKHCEARAAGRVNELPVKLTKKKSVKQQRTLYWIERDGKLLVWQRAAETRLMPGFWELPEQPQLEVIKPGQLMGRFKHGITIYDYRFEIVEALPPLDVGDCCWRLVQELTKGPISTIFKKAMQVVENHKSGGGVSKASAAVSG